MQTNAVLPLKTLVVKTYPLFLLQGFAIVPGMFIRPHKHFKNGKWHTYYSVLENHRYANGQHIQRSRWLTGYLDETGSPRSALQEHLETPEPQN